jgi:hypothetical protein
MANNENELVAKEKGKFYSPPQPAYVYYNGGSGGIVVDGRTRFVILLKPVIFQTSLCICYEARQLFGLVLQ